MYIISEIIHASTRMHIFIEIILIENTQNIGEHFTKVRVDLNEKQNIRSSHMAIQCTVANKHYFLNNKGDNVLITQM
jgi:hypothetical protein